MRLFENLLLLSVLSICLLSCSDSEQQPDPDFIPKNNFTSFSPVNSPIVFIDEAHYNFHTIKGRYKPFAQVLISDGYTVKPSKRAFTLAHLKQADILVIANALDKHRSDWEPPYENAFTTDEITAIKKWVTAGGSLFLIADHTPFPKIIEKLLLSFGFVFSHRHVREAMFRKDEQTLSSHTITNSKINNDAITRVRTFGGSAFKIPQEAISLLTLREGMISLEPEIPFQLNEQTNKVSVAGWSQGAIMEVGEGRIAVFAEAMMFSSQIIVSTGEKRGLLSAGAEQNEQFLLNVMHWLSKVN